MTHYRNQQDYFNFQNYQRDLRRTTNSLGILLLVFIAAELIFSLILLYGVLPGAGIDVYHMSDALENLLNGMLSSSIFFGIGALYCLFKGKSFARLFPFEKIGGRMVVMLSVIGLAISLASNYAADLTTEVFSLFGLQNKGGEILSDDSLPAVLLYYLTVAVLPAFAEEFAFRGVIMGSLRPYSDALALLVSSAAFALMHGNFVQIPFTFCCGLAFGFIAVKTNSLLPSIIIHFLNNALAVTADILSAYSVVPDDVIYLGYAVIFLITAGLALIFLRRLIREKSPMLTFSDSDKGIPFREKVKTAASTPTLIAFEAVMLFSAATVIIHPYLEELLSDLSKGG